MTNNTLVNKRQSSSNWIYVLLTYLSFVWITLYPATNMLTSSFMFGYGNLFDTTSSNFSYIVAMVLVESLFAMILFEIIFYLYKYFLSFKIYTFVVPQDKFKIETRLFVIYRNIFYGLLLNLCFLYPYLYALSDFFNVVITLIALIAYAKHINKTYSEPIIGHFVFKNFCFPVCVYEAMIVISLIAGVL